MQRQSNEQEQRQRVQEQLVEQAKQIPGVSEMMAVYARLTPYSATPPTQPLAKISYATGGNR